MKLIAVCAILLLVAFMVYALFPPGTPYSIDKVVRAWADPAGCRDVETMDAMLDLQSAVGLTVIVGPLMVLGGLIALFVGGRRE